VRLLIVTNDMMLMTNITSIRVRAFFIDSFLINYLMFDLRDRFSRFSRWEYCMIVFKLLFRDCVVCLYIANFCMYFIFGKL
jgi:hypothetical protein